MFRMEAGDMPYSLNDFLWNKCRIEQAACDVTPRSIGKIEEGADLPSRLLYHSNRA